MSDTTRSPAIRGTWTIWVPYVVQPRTRIADLLERVAMTKAEWNHVNPEHPTSKPLRTGDKVWIKDPIATCEMYRTDALRYSDGVPLSRFFSYNCEEIYSAFKPLRAFTKELRKK